MDYRFVLDNNVLTRIGVERVRSEFVRHRCRVPDEVVYEAGDSTYVANLRTIEVRVDVSILRHLEAIMARLAPGTFDLVDLFKNRGNADPLLVATALHLRDLDEGTLFASDWVVASDDRAVIECATEVGLRTINLHDLAQLIDEAHGEAM